MIKPSPGLREDPALAQASAVRAVFTAFVMASSGLFAADKSAFSLSNPTPDSLLRELSTDRPDKTESAYTVDAGRVQVELDVVSATRDRDGAGGADVRTTSWTVANTNLKLGLRHDLDVQLVVESFTSVKTDDRVARQVTRQSGFGDVTLRLKKNFWGNDEGTTAFAVMPFVKLPTNRDRLGNGAVEGGVIVPLAVALPKGWGMGLMTEVDWVRDDAGGSSHASFINTVTFSHDITEKLGGYVEFFSEIPDKSGSPWVGTVDLGLTCGVTNNIQFDVGVNLGVTHAADDAQWFLGFTRRF